MVGAALPSWDLGDLYKGSDDPAIERALRQALGAAKAFSKKYRGKVAKELASPAPLRSALGEYERIHLLMSRPISFAGLRFAETSADPSRGAFLQKMKARNLEIHHELIFFYLELL